MAVKVYKHGGFVRIDGSSPPKFSIELSQDKSTGIIVSDSGEISLIDKISGRPNIKLGLYTNITDQFDNTFETQELALTYLTEVIGGSVVTVPFFDQKVFNGEAFGVARRFELGTSDTVYIVFNPIPVTKKTVNLIPVFINGIGARLNIDLLVNVTENGDGTAWPPVNRNGNSANVSALDIRYDATVTNEGTLAAEYVLSADGTGAASNVGGEAGAKLPLVANKSIKYAIKITNTSNTSTFYGDVVFDWAEYDIQY